MAINPPKWASQCVPTTKGWQDPKTGEILVGGSISNAAIAEWHEARAPKPAPKKKASKPKPKMIKESPTTEEEFVDEVMTEDEDELLTEEPKKTFW
jgi:hypothetical protein